MKAARCQKPRGFESLRLRHTLPDKRSIRLSTAAAGRGRRRPTRRTRPPGTRRVRGYRTRRVTAPAGSCRPRPAAEPAAPRRPMPVPLRPGGPRCPPGDGRVVDGAGCRRPGRAGSGRHLAFPGDAEVAAARMVALSCRLRATSCTSISRCSCLARMPDSGPVIRQQGPVHVVADAGGVGRNGQVRLPARRRRKNPLAHRPDDRVDGLGVGGGGILRGQQARVAPGVRPAVVMVPFVGSGPNPLRWSSSPDRRRRTVRGSTGSGP